MEETCLNLSCFFCIMKQSDPSLRQAGLAKCFKEMPLKDDEEQVLVLSGLWNIAMNQPNHPEFPSLGVFECMASLIHKGINNRDWLVKDQNIYIPYYAAHVIGSYTMNKEEFAVMAVKSGVMEVLMELMRGKLSWVEQRAAVRAMGHLASYQQTFDAVAGYKKEVVELALEISSTCLDNIYVQFFAVKDNSKQKRLKYHCDLLTRGIGGVEMENRKAEEWASQLQCWSIYLLNCFACKEKCLNLICKAKFLRDLCGMWGGVANHSSPAGVGLIRILCYSKIGRRAIAKSNHVIQTLCNLSRSSDDWQYMGIDCLLLLLQDQETRIKVLEIAASFLIDLVEIRSLGGRNGLGEAISRALMFNYRETKLKFKNDKRVQKVLEELWDLKIVRRKVEMALSEEAVREKRVLVYLLKQQANEKFWAGEIEEALVKYTEALDLCPLKMRKGRLVLYGNRAQCYLLLRDAESAISDSTRALCLSSPENSHGKSLWRRSQAYEMMGLAKESLMDCIMFVNGLIKKKKKGDKVPYYAAWMISKQMNSTWLFAASQSKYTNKNHVAEELNGGDDRLIDDDDESLTDQNNKNFLTGLYTITEEASTRRRGRKIETVKLRKKLVVAQSARQAKRVEKVLEK